MIVAGCQPVIVKILNAPCTLYDYDSVLSVIDYQLTEDVKPLKNDILYLAEIFTFMKEVNKKFHSEAITLIWYKNVITTKNQNQILIILVIVTVRCSELAKPIATTCAKAHNASLHRWPVDGNLCIEPSLLRQKARASTT